MCEGRMTHPTRCPKEVERFCCFVKSSCNVHSVISSIIATPQKCILAYNFVIVVIDLVFVVISVCRAKNIYWFPVSIMFVLDPSYSYVVRLSPHFHDISKYVRNIFGIFLLLSISILAVYNGVTVGWP